MHTVQLLSSRQYDVSLNARFQTDSYSHSIYNILYAHSKTLPNLWILALKHINTVLFISDKKWQDVIRIENCIIICGRLLGIGITTNDQMCEDVKLLEW